MKKTSLLSWLSIILLVFFLAACQTDDNQVTTMDTEERSTEPSESNEQSGPYSVTDDMGQEVTFEKVPETIVSLQPSNTEILFALGVGDKIVGVTDADHYPQEASDIERVSDTVNINAERIIELDPDVVLAYTIGEEDMLKPLQDAGIPVFVIQSASSFDDVYDDIAQIAEIMAVEVKGKEIIHNIRSQMEEVEAKLEAVEEPRQIYLEVSPAPDIYTTGKSTFQEEIIQKAGVENIFGEQEGWMKVSEEEVIQRNPGLIATTVDYIEDPIAEIKARNGWEEIKAIQNDEVYQLDGEMMTRPGPRIGEAVEQLAKVAYPEPFK